MATKPRTNHVKATAWTPTMRLDFTSTRADGAAILFRTLDTQEKRSACLKELHEIDAEMTARAMQAAQDDAQRTSESTTTG